MARYYVTAVQKDGSGIITQLFVHAVTANNVLMTGTKQSRDAVANLLFAANEVYTLRWNYVTAQWEVGAKIERVIVAGIVRPPYLRTVANTTTADNLDNMITMVGFI